MGSNPKGVEGCPGHCGTLAGLDGNSAAQDAPCHEIEWHEGFRHSETADLEVAAAAEDAL